MKIAITGATGFLGRYILKHLIEEGHSCRCWKRPGGNLTGLEDLQGPVEWIEGDLEDQAGFKSLVKGVDSVVHAALSRPAGFSFHACGNERFLDFLQLNLMGTLALLNTSRAIGVERFIFISSCATHDIILKDRPLDEAHPLWPLSHYGAHKAAIEKFIHSFGMGGKWDVCSLRPTGIYGLAQPPGKSKWADLIRLVKKSSEISVNSGGKEVHAGDVAKAVSLLLRADGIAGQSYNCYDMYISEGEVARIAREFFGVNCLINDTNQGPKNQIDTHKIRALGMAFGGNELLSKTVEEIAKTCRD